LSLGCKKGKHAERGADEDTAVSYSGDRRSARIGLRRAGRLDVRPQGDAARRSDDQHRSERQRGARQPFSPPRTGPHLQAPQPAYWQNRAHRDPAPACSATHSLGNGVRWGRACLPRHDGNDHGEGTCDTQADRGIGGARLARTRRDDRWGAAPACTWIGANRDSGALPTTTTPVSAITATANGTRTTSPTPEGIPAVMLNGTPRISPPSKRQRAPRIRRSTSVQSPRC